MSLSTAQTDRACGVILGSAVGDALGAGYEFGCAAVGPDGPAMIGGGLGNFAPGEWTDDTSMTWPIAAVAAKGADLRSPEALDEIAQGFLDWYASHPPDIGTQTRRVLSSTPRDTLPENPATTFPEDPATTFPEELAKQASRRATPGTLAAAMTQAAARLHERTRHTGGNGSLMRTAPVALAHLGDPTAIVDAAMAISALTHTDPRAGEACALWSLAINHAVLEGELDLRAGLEHLTQEACDFWTERIDEAEAWDPKTFTPNGYVVTALQAAWSAICHTPVPEDVPCLHLQDVLATAIGIGNDTDTVAAIAGGLLGARWGASAVPAAWRRIVHGYPGAQAERLVELAQLAVNGGRGGAKGWPLTERIDYAGWGGTDALARHPHDNGVWLGGVDALDHLPERVTAVVSLCLVGSQQVPKGVEHVVFRLIDQPERDMNPNLEFVIDDAARTVQALRDEGHVVLLHCVAAQSRTPTVAIAYAMLGDVPLETSRDAVCGALPSASPNRTFASVLSHTTTKETTMTSPDEVTLPIGKQVRGYLPAILQRCEEDEALFRSLLDEESSKGKFGLSWAFFKPTDEIGPGSHPRYWKDVYSVRGVSVRVSSQWFSKHRPAFLNFLEEQGIANAAQASETLAAEEKKQLDTLQASAVSKARFKGHAIGNAQNAFVRTMLSNLGAESFNKKDWLQIVSEFRERCAYCQVGFDSAIAARRLVMDHAVPINRVSLGEHCLGNLVPSCHDCNSAKGQKDYREFCTSRDALARIESHMQRHDYVPIDDERVGLFLETAYQEVRELSQRYLLLINSLLPEGRTGTALAEAPVAEREGAERMLRHEPMSEIQEPDQDLSADGC